MKGTGDDAAGADDAGVFTDRMINQKNASPRTICAYRDTMRLLLTFATETTGTPPSRLDIEQLGAPFIGAFLDHLERDRGNSPRTRNARLAAIHSLYGYAALRHPEHAHTIARVIEIPQKTNERATVCHLEPPEIKALLAAPGRCTWLGRRDHALLLTAIQTGLRVSELCGGVRIGHVRLEGGASIQVLGKRRKQRVTPLTPGTVKVLRVWLRERHGKDDPLFPTRQGGPLSPKAVAWLLDKHTTTAAARCPSLNKKRVPPHVLRHTNATLVLAKNDIATVALWLGHEGTKSTEVYLQSNTAINRKRSTRSPRSTRHPAATSPPTSSSRSWKASERSVNRPSAGAGLLNRFTVHDRRVDVEPDIDPGPAARAHRDALLVMRDPANDLVPHPPCPLSGTREDLAAFQCGGQHRELLILRDGPTQPGDRAVTGADREHPDLVRPRLRADLRPPQLRIDTLR